MNGLPFITSPFHVKKNLMAMETNSRDITEIFFKGWKRIVAKREKMR